MMPSFTLECGKPAPFKGKSVKYGDVVHVNEEEFDQLIHDRHFLTKEQFNHVISERKITAEAKEMKEKTKKKSKKDGDE